MDVMKTFMARCYQQQEQNDSNKSWFTWTRSICPSNSHIFREQPITALCYFEEALSGCKNYFRAFI